MKDILADPFVPFQKTGSVANKKNRCPSTQHKNGYFVNICQKGIKNFQIPSEKNQNFAKNSIQPLSVKYIEKLRDLEGNSHINDTLEFKWKEPVLIMLSL